MNCPACRKPMEPIIFVVGRERTPAPVSYYFCENRNCTFYISRTAKKDRSIDHFIGDYCVEEEVEAAKANKP